MTKEFVPYDLAIQLKELGFDEECFAHWFELEEKKRIVTKYENSDEWWDYNAEALNVSAPIYQQAFRWFREKYDLQYWLNDGGMLGKCFVKITGFKHDKFYFSSSEPMGYEEAELACLKKLIEIVKNKKL